jgi:cysteine desulfurase / selenocysteine lyase
MPRLSQGQPLDEPLDRVEIDVQARTGGPVSDLVARRRDFPALERFTWFNNGVVSITPSPVSDEYAARIREIAERGPMHVTFPEEEYPRRRASHAGLAAFLGARSEDVALVRGVSEAYQTILRGLDWERGDELILGSDEEGALLLPSLHLRKTRGVRLRFLPVSREPDELVHELKRRIGRRTRLVALSHVTTNLGIRLPIPALTEVAREHDVLSFVDVAHSAGLFEFSTADLGCDLVGALSYKWMYGPYAAGCLWVRPDIVPRIALRFAGNRSEAYLDEANRRYRLRPTADRFEYGPWTWPLIHAWAASVEYIDGLNRATIWDRTRELTQRLKQGLSSIDGVRVLTPDDPSRSAALVAFAIDNVDGPTASELLRTTYNIRIKHVPILPNALRASVAFFTLEEEIDRLVSAIRGIAHSSAALAGSPEPDDRKPAAARLVSSLPAREGETGR